MEHIESTPISEAGASLARTAAAVAGIVEQFREGFRLAQEAELERAKRRRAARAEYLASERGQLDRLAASCAGSVAGLVEYSDLVAKFYAERAHRELDELLERLGGGGR